MILSPDSVAVAVAVLKAKIVELLPAYEDGDSKLAVRGARSLVGALAIIGEPCTVFADFERACRALDEAEERGARSTRMDHATDGVGDAFRALVAVLVAPAA